MEFDPTAEATSAFGSAAGALPWSSYVALGDSTTEGLGEAYDGYPDVGWAQMVADALRAVNPPLRFENLGRRYKTTREIRTTQLEPALAARPELVTLVAGGNDILIEGWSPDITQAELDTMVEQLQGVGAQVLMCTMFDIFAAGLLNEKLTALLEPKFNLLNDVVRTVATTHDVPLVDLARDPISRDKDVYASDLQHANRRGHAATAVIIMRELVQVAAQSSEQQVAGR